MPFAVVLVVLLLTGCGSESGALPTNRPVASTGTPSPSGTASPSVTPSASQTPAPTSVPTPAQPDDADAPDAVPAPPGPVAHPAPQPTLVLGPDDVDPAAYPSAAIDDANGGIPMPGVAFRTGDGRIVCGIFTWGHLNTEAGTASCTVDSYIDVLPQAFPETGPHAKSVMVTPVSGSAGLYPDWFAQPARDIAVLADGEWMRYEGTDCTVTAGAVTCTVRSTGHGFALSTTSYTLF